MKGVILAVAAVGTALYATPARVASPAASASDAALAARALAFPLPERFRPALRDNYTEARGNKSHEALDIMAPRGTPVMAVDDGRVAKLFKSAAGGITLYQYDPTERYVYYYAHLDRYAQEVREGMQVKRGMTLGFVGSTGNASPDAPHLHFGIARLGREKQWWKGEAVNPYPHLARP